jgi:hypothetical protein
MARSFFITIRGVEREVTIDSHGGYDYSTGVYEIEWSIDGPDDLTEVEQEMVDREAIKFAEGMYDEDATEWGARGVSYLILLGGSVMFILVGIFIGLAICHSWRKRR